MRQGDQLLGQGVTFSVLSLETVNGGGIKEKTALEGRSTARPGSL
jgi:hypothetical protein